MSIKNTITITNTINTNKSYGITEVKEYKNNTNLKLKDNLNDFKIRIQNLRKLYTAKNLISGGSSNSDDLKFFEGLSIQYLTLLILISNK
jgi:hypothetical protein